MSASAYYQRATGAALGASRRATSGCWSRSSAVHAANYHCLRLPADVDGAASATGVDVGRDRVKRLMRAHGIQGAKRRGKPWRTTIADPAARPAARPRRARLHAPRARTAVGGGLLLPALLGGRGVLRVRHRRLQPPGRRLAARRPHAHRSRPRRAADGALAPPRRRRRRARASLRCRQPIHRPTPSRRSSTTTACSASIGSVGDAYDNALAESFVDSFKTELIADRVWRTRTQLELAIVEYVGWFNHVRLHEALGDRPPAEFEAQALSRPTDPGTPAAPALTHG